MTLLSLLVWKRSVCNNAVLSKMTSTGAIKETVTKTTTLDQLYVCLTPANLEKTQPTTYEENRRRDSLNLSNPFGTDGNGHGAGFYWLFIDGHNTMHWNKQNTWHDPCNSVETWFEYGSNDVHATTTIEHRLQNEMARSIIGMITLRRAAIPRAKMT